MMEEATRVVRQADIFVVVGTSLVVYPAAGLVNYAPYQAPKFIVDKKIPYTSSLYNLSVIEKPATEGVKELKLLLKDFI
jgi:NAD-dependent deacetylase